MPFLKTSVSLTPAAGLQQLLFLFARAQASLQSEAAAVVQLHLRI
jgi:hypothetical protein